MAKTHDTESHSADENDESRLERDDGLMRTDPKTLPQHPHSNGIGADGEHAWRKLNDGLTQLFYFVQELRYEFAAIERPANKDHRFDRMGDQLQEIVRTTEEASNAIMAAVEDSEALLDNLRQTPLGQEHGEDVERLSENGTRILQACSFQDITGQRVTKLVDALTSIETRINGMIETWGRPAVEDVVVEPEHVDEEEALLQGPSLKGEGISQADIDALFD